VWFSTDADCLDYLESAEMAGEVVCPDWGRAGGWPGSGGRFECPGCAGRTSVTASGVTGNVCRFHNKGWVGRC